MEREKERERERESFESWQYRPQLFPAVAFKTGSLGCIAVVSQPRIGSICPSFWWLRPFTVRAGKKPTSASVS